MGDLNIIKIDNSKKAAIAKGKWKNPGAKLYDTLMDAMWCEGDIPADPKEMEQKMKDGRYYHYDKFLKEAYLVGPDKDHQNSPYGRTPFARSGCKYPHHVVKGDKLVVSIPGLRSAYITARNQGCFHPDPSKRPEYSRALVAHLNRHLKELKMKAEWHHGEFYLIDESAAQIERNFHDIYSYIMEKTGINLFDRVDVFEEKNLKHEFRYVIGENDGHLYQISFQLNPNNVVSDNIDTGAGRDQLRKTIKRTGHSNYTSSGNVVLAITDMCTKKSVNEISAYPPIHNSGGSIMPMTLKQYMGMYKRLIKDPKKLEEIADDVKKECPTGVLPNPGWEDAIAQSKKNGQQPIHYKVGEVDNTTTYKTTNPSAVLKGMLNLESAMSNEAVVLNTNHLDEIGRTPEEIYEWMHNNISYDDTESGWKLRTPSEVYMDKKGNCHDQALFEALIFHTNQIVNDQLFFVEFSKDNPVGGRTHTLTWFRTAKREAKLSADWKAPFKEENAAQGPFKYYWFENAWENYAGIHGPYADLHELKQAVFEACKKDHSDGYDGIVFGNYPNHRCGMNLDQYVKSWRLKDEYLFNEDPCYFRVTYDGIGIYEAMKQHMSAEQWKKLLKSDKFTWLPKPKEYPSDCKSYFTKYGMDKFNELVMPVATGCLGNNIKVEKFSDVGDIVYRDQYQVITKSTDELIKESLDWIDRFVNDDEFRESAFISEAYTLKNLPDKMYFGTPHKITGKTISARSPRGLFLTPYMGIASMFIIDLSKELDIYLNDILRKNHRELISHSCNIEYDEWNLDSKELISPLAKTHLSHNLSEFNEVKDGTATGYIYEIDVSKIKNQLQTYVTDNPDREVIYKGDDKLPITGVTQHTINWTLKYKSSGQKGTFETRVIKESVDDTDVPDAEDLSKKDEPFVPIYGIIKSYSSSEYRNDGTKKSAAEMGSVKFDKIIHKVTRGDNYSHALVSFDDSLTEMYSYEDEGFCIDNILTKESWMSTKSIYICVMFVRESDRDRMKAYISGLKEHPEETRYAMGNLLKAYIATPTKIDKRFVCSSFTGFIMSCSNPKNLRRDYSRMRPDDITLLPRAFYVANVRDREEFKERHQEIKDRVNAIYDEYKEDINDYNNHLPRIMLQDRVDKYKTIDKIFDWIINKLA